METLQPALIDRIVNRSLTKNELNQIENDFMKHLKLTTGTIETYCKKHIVRKIMQHYPEVIDPKYDKEYTNRKIGGIFEVYANNVIHCKVTNPTVMQYIANYMSGIKDNQNLTNQPQIVIYAMAPEEKEGSYTLPEPKIPIIDI